MTKPETANEVRALFTTLTTDTLPPPLLTVVDYIIIGIIVFVILVFLILGWRVVREFKKGMSDE